MKRKWGLGALYLSIVICLLAAIAARHFGARDSFVADQRPIINLVQTPLVSTTTEVAALKPTKPFTILVVPGHDTDTGGAHFKDVYERDIVVEIANKISGTFDLDTDYKVIVARSTKAWNPLLQDYFDANEKTIIDWKSALQTSDRALMSSGQKRFVPDMASHSSVDKKTSLELYGLNKWAGENDVDLVIHLHFNDSERPNMNAPGEYKGFTIFIPEHQMINSFTSRAIAKDIYRELKKSFSPEIVGDQADGLLEDQSLIALGASGTLLKPAILIEYGYVYEKDLLESADRERTLSAMAGLTVAGIRDYVENIEQRTP